MLIARQESWGRVVLDPKDDEIWAEMRLDAQAPRIDRPLSVTCWLGGSPLPRGGRSRRWLPGVEAWVPILDALQQAGLLRLNLAGFASVPRGDLLEIVAAGIDRNLGVVVSAEDCTPDLEKCSDLPSSASLQILFDPVRVWRTDITTRSRFSLARRLDILHHCVISGRRVRVLTPYDPFSPITLVELGEELVQAGVKDWLISPPLRGGAQGSAADAALAEIRALREYFPYIEIRYGSFLERELDVVIRPNGRVRVRRGGRGRRAGAAVSGMLSQLTQPGWLPAAFMDRHADLWVSGTLELCEPASPETGPSPDVFLSYNREDREVVLALRDQLAAAGIRTWIDESLEAGDAWQNEIAKAMEQSPTILICIGPAGLGRTQEKLEFPAAMSLMVKRQTRVVPVLLPGLQDEPNLPLFLEAFSYVDLRQSAQEGLARLIKTILRDRKAEPEQRETSGRAEQVAL